MHTARIEIQVIYSRIQRLSIFFLGGGWLGSAQLGEQPKPKHNNPWSEKMQQHSSKNT